MSKHATSIGLTDEERKILEGWVRASTTEHRLALRARIVLAASQGQQTTAISREMRVRPATASKWRTRFARERLAGLQDAPRSGKPATYDVGTTERIFEVLDRAPPAGHATWTGGMVAEALGDVSPHQVWRVLRRQGIHLQRRRSWCVSTDPEFTAKAADIVGLYLAPPEGAVVVCVEEKPNIQALERAQGWLRLPNGRALTGFTHEYKRHGTTTLFAALEVATGQVRIGHYTRKRRREFLDFMNDLVAAYPDTELHVILDNLSTHKPKHDRWLARHPKLTFHFTPTHASWLNQVEIWLSVLWRRTLRGASFISPQQVRLAIDNFVASYNQRAAPFEWRKITVHQGSLKNSHADLCK